jgi:hypothetical protein
LPADPGLLFDGPTEASTTLALVHGAGTGGADQQNGQSIGPAGA